MKPIKSKFIFLVLIILCSQLAVCQTEENFDFSGVIMTEDSTVFSYRIYLSISNGVVRGHSISDYTGLDETKTTISGMYDYQANLLLFKETRLVYTKSAYEADLCYVHGQCTMSTKNKKAVLSGEFSGLYPDGDTCARGKISLLSTAYAVKQLAKAKKLAKLVASDSSSHQLSQLIPDSVGVEQRALLKQNENISYNWSGNVAVMRFYDNGDVDGDVISVAVNGKLFVPILSLTKQKKSYHVPLIKGKNVITIEAQNVGRSFPNTSHITIEDSESVHELKTALGKGQKTSITIYR